MTECNHLRCGLSADNIIKHKADGRGVWHETVCDNHAEHKVENDPTAVKVVN